METQPNSSFAVSVSLLTGMVAVALAVGGCVGQGTDAPDAPSQSVPTSARSASVGPDLDGSERSLRPDLMVVEPDPAVPGEVVSLTFPEQTERGIAFVLQRRADSGWETSHLMTSNANGDEYMDTAPADTDSFDVIDVGIAGPGPDDVRLPADAGPGDYRICTGNAGDEFCAEFEITEITD